MKRTPHFALKLLAASVVFVMLGFGAYIVGKHDAVVPDGRVHVVAAENFWGSIASQIGGEHAAVTSIMSDPSADPHIYESNAHDALEISRANLVIVNGLGYDDFMNKLMSASTGKNRVTLSISDALGASADANPHLWYDIARVHVAAAAIQEQFARIDPAHAASYAKNLQKFNATLGPLYKSIDSIKTQFPGIPVTYTERVPEYLLTSAGFSLKIPGGFASAIEEGNDPSPAAQDAMNKLISGKQVKIVFYNAQATSPVTERLRALAQKSGVAVVGVTETIPANIKTYQQWQQNQLDAIIKALQ